MREWTLRIESNNHGGAYVYSGSDYRYPEDDYLEVVEKVNYTDLEEKYIYLRSELCRISCMFDLCGMDAALDVLATKMMLEKKQEAIEKE